MLETNLKLVSSNLLMHLTSLKPGKVPLSYLNFVVGREHHRKLSPRVCNLVHRFLEHSESNDVLLRTHIRG